MNLDSIKKSLAKIPAWIKANPKKAGVVAVVVIVIAYFAIKRGASDTGETTAAPGLDSAGGGLSDSELIASGGGGSISGGTSTDSSGETTTTTTTTESGGGFSGDSGGGFSESDFIPAIAPSGFVNSAPAFTGGAESILSNPTAALFRPASEMSGIKSAISNTGVAAASTLTKVTAPAASNKGNDTLRNALKTVTKTQSIATPAPRVTVKTDAERAGLAKYFTGVSGGRRYAAGVFVGNVATVAPAKKSNSLVKRV